VIRQLLARWPDWPSSPKALARAWKKVADLGSSEDERGRLARVCNEAASRRFDELSGFLRRQRHDFPTRPSLDDEIPPIVATGGRYEILPEEDLSTVCPGVAALPLKSFRKTAKRSDSKSSVLTGVRVRLPPRALIPCI